MGNTKPKSNELCPQKVSPRKAFCPVVQLKNFLEFNHYYLTFV